jgi:hypothetical protein
MRQSLKAALVAAVLTLLPTLTSAQTLGIVAGSVKDASGAVLPGVTVEVSSPALIERVRTATTDGAGLYRIINLPPGVYSVAFSLPGFNTVRREQVQVSAGFTASIDAEMKVGSVQETVTVTGESPVIDVQSAATTRSLTADTFKEIPSSGSWLQMASLVPAIRASVQDVGGVLGDQTGAQVSAHGSRSEDGVSMLDGLRIGNMYQSSNLTNMSLSPLLFEQVDVQVSGQAGETGTNGVVMNAVPKSGGNRFSGSALANGSSPSLQGSNITSRLTARGLTKASTTLKKLYDLNGAVGGPVMKDKLWFFGSSRYFTNYFYLADRYFPADNKSFARPVSNQAEQAYGGTYTYDNNVRLTWGLSDKQKLSGWYAYQYKVDPYWLIQTFTQAPEASRITTWHTQLSTLKYTYTPTSRFLVEAGMAAGASPDTIKVDLARIGGIAVVEQGGTDAFGNVYTPLTYRAPTSFDFDDRLPSQAFNVSGSYVTGSHNAKIGMELQRGHFWRGDNNDSTGGLWYTARAGDPIQFTIEAPVTGYQNNLNYNLGWFAQDRWTVRRLTLNGGVRVDLQNESTAAFTAAPHKWAPNRNATFAAVKNVPNWKDVNPRLSAAYDVFGTGKTALKASASRGVRQDSVAIALANNPATTITRSTARNWTDNNGNRTPDCDPLNPAAQSPSTTGSIDTCGAWLSPTFGTAAPTTFYDPAILDGWGVRPYNWEFSASVQQEVMPRLSVGGGYFRRINGNFQITDNENLTAADFTRFNVTLPTSDSRLPGAGQTVAGYYDVNRIVAPKNVVKDASKLGKQIEHWDGVDVNVDARLRSGLRMQGGLSTGKTTTDNCDIVDDAPEILGGSPAAYCHQESPFLAQYKALASYTLPWWGVRIAGTFQSIPGPNILGNVSGPSLNGASGAGSTTLGRSFTSAATQLALIQPQTVFGDRLNEVDLRFTKVLRVHPGSLDLNFDIFNAFNSDAILGQSNTFVSNQVSPTTWQRPTSVIQPRFLKVSVRWDF